MAPRLPERYVRRPALVERLSSTAPVVALVGPYGSGKTSLLVEWAGDRDDVVWARGRIPEPAAPSERYLVIDDAHLLPAEAWWELERVQARWLGVRLATTSVSSLPGHLVVDTVDELAFSPEETARLLRLFGTPSNPGLVHSVTGGLPAAVLIAARDGGGDRDQLMVLLSERGHSLPAELSALALHSHLTTALVRRLGADDSALEVAESAGWGQWRGVRCERCFELVAPIRAATLVAHPIPAAQERKQRAIAAEQLFAERQWSAALIEALLAERYELADAVVKRTGLDAIGARLFEVRVLLEQVPLHVLRKYPVLAFMLALMLYAKQETRQRAFDVLNLSVSGVRTMPRNAPDRALLRVVESVASRLAQLGDGGTRAALATAEIMGALTPGEREQLSGLLPLVHSHVGVSAMYGEQFAVAREQFEQSLGPTTSPRLELLAWGGLATIEVLVGDLAVAERWIAVAEARSWPPQLRSGYNGTLLVLAKAGVALEQLDFETAERELELVWPDIATNEHWAAMLYGRAILDIGTGCAREGLERLRLIRAQRTERAGLPAAIERRLHFLEHLLALAAGELFVARTIVASESDVPQLQMAGARIALIENDVELAVELLSKVTPRHASEKQTAAILHAIVLGRLGRADQAAESVGVVRASVQTTGRRVPLLFIPSADRGLFGELMAGVPEVVGMVKAAPVLSKRERVVLRELFGRASLHEIAAKLQVSENTLKSQRRSLYRKLGAGSRQDAIAAAIAFGLLNG